MKESLSPLAHRCKQKVQKIRLKCQAGQGMLDPSLEKECEGRGEEKRAGNLATLEKMGRNGMAGARSQCACGSKVIWNDC